MRLSIEFDSEWWRIADWWRRTQCRMTGHPGWTPPRRRYVMFGFVSDERLRCVRCGVPDPTEPAPKPLVHSFVGLDWSHD